TTLQAMDRMQDLQKALATDQEIAAYVQAVGPDRLHDVLFDPNTTRVSFSAVDPAVAGAASLWDNPDWTAPRLVFKLPEGIESSNGYRLAIVDDDRNVVEILGPIDGGKLEYRDLEARPAGRLAICDAEGEHALLLAESAL
ncbi:MAG: hypothetical protein KDA28_17380, partial [Phycisphaerales bacterium]|nr:hypothetical protein [Phycisphaerales bacterium]